MRLSEHHTVWGEAPQPLRLWQAGRPYHFFIEERSGFSQRLASNPISFPWVLVSASSSSLLTFFISDLTLALFCLYPCPGWSRMPLAPPLSVSLSLSLSHFLSSWVSVMAPTHCSFRPWWQHLTDIIILNSLHFLLWFPPLLHYLQIISYECSICFLLTLI